MYEIVMSYPRRANREGEITDFRVKLEYSLQLKTGDQQLRIFQDTEDIDVGDRWRSRLEESIDGAGFFMPLVQPLFFSSTWCKEEFEAFDARMKAEGLTDRILPILWERVDDLAGQGAAATRLEEIQYFDWTKQRLRDWDQEKRLALDRFSSQLALRLKGAREVQLERVRGHMSQESDGSTRRSATNPQAEGALEELLMGMFSVRELERFIRHLPGAFDVVHSVAWHGSARSVSVEVVASLARRGLIQREFFDRLAGVRPGRRRDIETVAGSFGLAD